MDLAESGDRNAVTVVARLQQKVAKLQKKLQVERFAKEDAITAAKLEQTKLRRQIRSEREAHEKRVSLLLAQKHTWREDALIGRGKELRDLRTLLNAAEVAKTEALQFSPRNASRPDLDLAGEASTL